jgi:hypothetical protein
MMSGADVVDEPRERTHLRPASPVERVGPEIYDLDNHVVLLRRCRQDTRADQAVAAGHVVPSINRRHHAGPFHAKETDFSLPPSDGNLAISAFPQHSALCYVALIELR